MSVVHETNVGDSVYVDFVRHLSVKLAASFNELGKALFTTDVDRDALWAAYLDSFKDPVERQYHNCSCCRHFIKTYGGLAVIDSNLGLHTTAFWDADAAPEQYKPALRAMAKLVAKARVNGVFLSSDTTWGRFEDGGWNHFALKPTAAMLYRAGVKTAGQAMAEKLEDYKTVLRALAEFDASVLNKALHLLRGDELYRSERFLAPVEWLAKTQAIFHRGGALAKATLTLYSNLLWHAVATAPVGFCHPRTSVVGTLLEHIKAGMDLADVKRRFADKVKPSVYQRPQAAPTAGAVQQAEKLFEQLQLAPALPRRFARLAEIPLLWKPFEPERPKAPEGSIFGHVKLKGEEPKAAELLGTTTTVMTLDKFHRTVLPYALEMHVQVPASSDRCMALLTAADPTAPLLFQWDNPFSWYYATGVDAEIKQRVLAAGGMYDNVDLRFSLIWNNRNDLDIHVMTPSGEHLYYGNKRCARGQLDVDRNVNGETMTPIENVRWERGQAAPGRYRIWVENYGFHMGGDFSATPFRAEIEVNGKLFHFDGATPQGCTRQASRVEVADVHFVRGADEVRGAKPVVRGVDAWGLTPGSFVRITGVTSSPNFWGERHVEHAGRHVFFLLDGCQDKEPGVGRGFFPEMLRSDLRQVRSVLEAYNATAEITGRGEADACGIGVSSTQGDIGLTLRVRTEGGIGFYKIDRWD